MEPKARPIMFSGPMIRAVHDGGKTQTRRVIKPQPHAERFHKLVHHKGRVGGLWTDRRLEAAGALGEARYCPYGKVGDLLWVRETHRQLSGIDWGDHCRGAPIEYRADGEHPTSDIPWRRPIHMPRWASRTTLEITDIRAQRLQEINENDAQAEGVIAVISRKIHGWTPHALEFYLLWDSINAKRGYSWKSNPWVWALTFRMLKGGDA